MVVEGDGRAYQSEYIRLGEIRGNVVVRPTADEDFPASFGQVRQAIEQVIGSKDAELQSILAAPVNRPILSHYLGLPDLVDPDGDNRSKQFREIDQLMQGTPGIGSQGQVQPSIAPEVLVDNHAVHIAAVREWAVSQAGLQAKAARPEGYANVIAHLLAHMDAEQAMAEQMQQRRSQVQAAGAPSAPPAWGGMAPGETPGTSDRRPQ